MNLVTEVLVIGGGVTGCGVLFDLAQRGFRCLLVERGALSSGTSGRMGGLIHSGTRYAPNDPVTARECIQENYILRRIMPGVIEDTGALYVCTPWDPPEYGDVLYQASREAGIPTEEISPAEALRREPLLHPGLQRAFFAPEATVDTWAACRALAESAGTYGAQVLVYHEVVALLFEQGRVVGARARDVISGEQVTITCDMAVNAAGAWGDRVAALAGCPVTLQLSKGTGVAMNLRLVHSAVIRCRPPSDIDGLLPVGTVTVVNATSVPISNADCYPIEAWEIQLLLDQAEQVIPDFRRFRMLRAWAGARPLYQEGAAASDQRQLTRDHTLLDHGTRDGVEGFVTITGGKWTTYRLMAEQTVDLVCRKLGIERPCRTAGTAIASQADGRFWQLGGRMAAMEHGEQAGEQIICECELVTRPQIEAHLASARRHVINDARRDLRVGMGPCQGGFCAYRVAAIMHEQCQLSPRGVNKALVDFLQERWKGITPVLWGGHLRQMQLDEGIYLGLLGLDKLPATLSGSDQSRVGELGTEGVFEVGNNDSI